MTPRISPAPAITALVALKSPVPPQALIQARVIHTLASPVVPLIPTVIGILVRQVAVTVITAVPVQGLLPEALPLATIIMYATPEKVPVPVQLTVVVEPLVVAIVVIMLATMLRPPLAVLLIVVVVLRGVGIVVIMLATMLRLRPVVQSIVVVVLLGVGIAETISVKVMKLLLIVPLIVEGLVLRHHHHHIQLVRIMALMPGAGTQPVTTALALMVVSPTHPVVRQVVILLQHHHLHPHLQVVRILQV
jgi:hypothetical protein